MTETKRYLFLVAGAAALAAVGVMLLLGSETFVDRWAANTVWAVVGIALGEAVRAEVRERRVQVRIRRDRAARLAANARAQGRPHFEGESRYF